MLNTIILIISYLGMGVIIDRVAFESSKKKITIGRIICILTWPLIIILTLVLAMFEGFKEE